MDIRLNKENIQLERLSAAGRGQTVVEGEITLPGGLREEARALHAGAMAVVDAVEAMQDRAAVSGKVVFHALYTQGDPGKVQAVEASADFTHVLDMPGMQPRNLCSMDVQVEHVDASASGGRLTMKAVVTLLGRAISQQPVEALSGLSGDSTLQLSTRTMKVKRMVAEGSGEVLMREEFMLPEGQNVRDTLYGTAFAQMTDVTGGLGRAGVAGRVMLEAVHASDMPGKPVVITRHTLPFEHAVDLNGEDGQQLAGRVTIRDVAVASQEMDGRRILRAEVLLGVQAWAERKEELTVLDDAYTVSGDELRLTSQEVSCCVEDVRVQTAESGKMMLMLPDGAPPVRSMLCAFAVPVMTGREQLGGRMTAEGMLEVTLLYMSDDNPAPVTVRQEEPFRVTFAAECTPEDFVSLSVSDAEASAITSDRVEMKYIMHMTASGVRTEQTRLVTDAISVSAEEMDSGIVLYFTQPGETLWDIAKRYRVPVQEVRALNPDLSGEPKTGQGVVVWRRAQEVLRV